MTNKYRCIKSYYWNLTQPYYKFEEGQIYDIRGNEDTCYHFTYCDAIMSPGSFCSYFISVEEFRENKIDKIFI